MYTAYLYKIITYSLEVRWAIIVASLLLIMSIGSYAVQRKIRFKIVTLFLLSLLAIQILPKVLNWIFALGSDSFAELNNIDIKDAWFYLTTLGTVFSPPGGLKSALLIVEWVSMLIILILLFRYNSKILVKLGNVSFYVIISLILIITAKGYIAYAKNSDLYNEISRNFAVGSDITIIRSDVTTKAPDLIVYIGESTSVLNMSLYGYPRETTPNLSKLSKLDGFIKFDNVLSTHTHTSESLLKALSIPAGERNPSKPIYKDKRVSIIDVLESTGVETLWVSNQNRSGAWNLASSVIAKNASNKLWSSHNIHGLFSNANMNFQYDDVFFSDVLKSGIDYKVVFLHSKAGHGFYRDYIPPDFRGNIDAHYRDKSLSSIFGDKNIKPTLLLLDEVEAYDSSIKYIDYSLSKILDEEVLNSNKEKIFIYFSDHGESVFTDRGHDSSRFVFEMATVPLVIVFNKAAKDKYPDKFNELKKLSEDKQILTLDIVSQIINFIYDININGTHTDLKSFARNNIKNPILVRDTVSGKTGVSLLLQPSKDTEAITYINNDSMNHLLANQSANKSEGTMICHHRSNSVASALRGLLASNCIEVDVVVNGDNVNTYHPPKKNHGLQLSTIFDLMIGRDSSVWLDSKNIDNPDACNSLYYFLEDQSSKEKLPKNVLVEFPSNTDFSNDRIIECSKRLSSIVDLAYYVPHDTGGICLKELKENNMIHSVLVTNKSCLSFKDRIEMAIKNGYVTEISFDFGLKDLAILLKDKIDVRMDIWGVDRDNLSEIIDDNDYHMILPINYDVNFY